MTNRAYARSATDMFLIKMTEILSSLITPRIAAVRTKTFPSIDTRPARKVTLARDKRYSGEVIENSLLSKASPSIVLLRNVEYRRDIVCKAVVMTKY